MKKSKTLPFNTGGNLQSQEVFEIEMKGFGLFVFIQFWKECFYQKQFFKLNWIIFFTSLILELELRISCCHKQTLLEHKSDGFALNIWNSQSVTDKFKRKMLLNITSSWIFIKDLDELKNYRLMDDRVTLLCVYPSLRLLTCV